MEPTFSNLLKISLERQYPPTTFAKLFRDFEKKQANTNNGRIDTTPLYIDSGDNYLQRSYIFEILVGSDLENNFEEFINFFSVVSEKLKFNDQHSVLLFINQTAEKFPWKNYAQNVLVLNCLSAYSKYLVSNFVESEEFTRISNLFVKILINIFKVSNAFKLNENFVQTTTEFKLDENFVQSTTEFMEWLNAKSLHDAYKPLNFYLGEYVKSSVKFGFSSNDPSHLQGSELVDSLNFSKRKPAKLSEKDNIKLLKIKKIIWLSQKITIEFVNLNDQFIIDFKNLISLSNVSTMESVSSLSMELLSGIIQCIKISNSRNKAIFREYLVCKIPWFLKYVLKINQNKLEKVFETLSNDESEFFTSDTNLLFELQTNMIELELLRENVLEFEKGNKLLTDDQREQSYTIEELNQNYTYKFIECNPEFTSIEETGIVDFVKKVNKSIRLKHKFCDLFMESLDSFMLTGDTLRLRRLLISASLNFDVLDNLLLYSSPYKLLIPLLKFLENQVTQTPENAGMNTEERYLDQSNQPDLMMDLDIPGDDSSNAQDYFSDLSTILVFSQFIIARYALTLKECDLSAIPKTLSLLKNTGLIYDKDTKDGNPFQETKLDDEIVNKWISSMFDPSNVDGISDSLIKLSTPLDYSQLIPRIVNEAIICNNMGWLDDDTLMGGLEYMHQKFLVGWMAYVIEEICNLKWKNGGKEPKMDAILEKVLQQLLETNTSDSIDIQVIIKLVKETEKEKISLNFPQVKLDEQISAGKLTLDQSCRNIIKFVSPNEKDKQEHPEFELAQVWSLLLSQNLAVDYLYEELKSLIQDSQISAELSYELVSILLVMFARWVVGDSIKTKWPVSLAQINDSDQSATELQMLSLIFNRKPATIAVKGYKKRIETKTENDENKVESGFFGFIQEPKSDESDNNMTNLVEEAEKGIDIYGENLLLIAYEHKGDRTTETFLRKVLDHLG
ncbi:hypothetical protein PICMEDRAFT_74042 [Pichia membranifaciens NRRL Y-2026]|uniref:Mediator of RNA polymerase II transcription subunit 5 n=1 Tax=Pichia membranifaciens NRRL Y-2026 TaxID=763406 RepID=A0A1E3NGK2_9ASCO|nr:hypothetical protein PICMEDRAFT_74042 [Pichia membranifaciens NRRL Y-2026]ODQ45271.1 hypothetical protein PICMEDRAFT_74042 [Pichia membranifaciens NRRL Y-2026]